MKRPAPKKVDEGDEVLAKALERLQVVKAELAEALVWREKAVKRRQGLKGDEAEAAKAVVEEAANRAEALKTQEAEAFKRVQAVKAQQTHKLEKEHKQKKAQKRKQAAKRERILGHREGIEAEPVFEPTGRTFGPRDSDIDWEAEEAYEKHLSAIERQRQDELERQATEGEQTEALERRKKAEAREREKARKQAVAEARAQAEARKRQVERSR